ncbi:hypothetical protein EJ04DRAFT_500829 [Polyplosphaeria fusca]|uniref:F-box domain-containing protein n=1 Tax=Polyplosphaeria fusca TaxID=682080 RepID=A0A9P4QSR1_9PLEO|nr:hypothetical protein EJ04DRAFT_500829 [Polyplosphaeria fusca]
MDSSPLSFPGTPRTASPSLSLSPSPSPSPSQDELKVPASPGPGDAPTTAPMAEICSDANGAPEAGAHDAAPSTSNESITKLLKGKEKARTGPLRLLDLPVDILKEIIHQLPHTNDLTSLALCHSALHRLAIPCIYSRFDIVWPDESTHAEPRTGVDALTYGLATLVMSEESFPHQNRYRQALRNPFTPYAAPRCATPYAIPRRRFGNYYAQFTKKFSLGNGPPAWVQEYMISKEGGKMLGTLVALAVARMVNLETFVWDMPTGVLRDVWLALSSLADRTDGEECRLEKLWVRWHDNTVDSPAPVPPPPPMVLNNIPPPPNTTHTSGIGMPQAPVVIPMPFTTSTMSALDRVENPTFSVIPPLKSLSVLDIDELPYLDELSVLIARSQHKMRELRVGIAPHAQQRDWVTAWDGDGVQQVDHNATWPAASSIGEKRLGGVLGILVGRIFDMRQSQTQNTASQIPTASATKTAEAQAGQKDAQAATFSSQVSGTLVEREPDALAQVGSLLHHPPSNGETAANPFILSPGAASVAYSGPTVFGSKPKSGESNDRVLNGKLKLENLELERVPLSVSILLKVLDWSMLTSLTLLNCNNHEHLWKALRKTFTPRASHPAGSPSSSTKAYRASYTLRSDYGLNIKRIQTNTVSPSLISFLKETLAPNTLEVLFLQEGRSYTSSVTVDAIYRGALRRHRASLKKLMIDSSERGPDGHVTSSSRWRKWMINREIITFLTSGRMSSIQELAISVEYRDWHYFLQRLPTIPQIRSLYIPFIADHVHGNNIDPRELAMQILDIVHLRPEIQLIYAGISVKCFEILENRPSNYDFRSDGLDIGDDHVATNDGLLSDDESEATEDDEDDIGGIADVADESASEASYDDQDESDGDDSCLSDSQKAPKLKLREIMYYEEKVSIFKARHGILKP